MGLPTVAPQRFKPAVHAKPTLPIQGQWTYEDYCRLPEDGLIYEVIEGELYMSPAPRPKHQKCRINLASALNNYGQETGVGEAYDAPIDVILPGQTSPVQPDVIFIAKKRLRIIKEERIEGAPDLVVEVLSPWNWTTDRGKKAQIYAQAGVREYWIVDPEARIIEVFTLKRGIYELVGKYKTSDTVSSKLLPGFKVKVKEVCPAKRRF